jgi:hypothetical protein
MVTKEGIAELKERLTAIRNSATSFFDKAPERQDQSQEYNDIWDDLLRPKLRQEGEDLRARIKRLSVDIAGAARGHRSSLKQTSTKYDTIRDTCSRASTFTNTDIGASPSTTTKT